MIRYYLIAISIVLFSINSLSAQSQQLAKLAFYENVEAAIEIVEPKFTVGVIPQGVPITHKFSVKNTGSEPLIILDVAKPCGCQKATWSKEPILYLEIQVMWKHTYNAAKAGKFTKSFTVKHNGAGGSLQLVMSGTVKKLDVADDKDTGESGAL